MAVFPENMDKLDVNDPASSLGIIENYIRYMGERVEFSMRNVTRNVTEAGVSSAEMYILMTALSNDLSALKSTVNGQSGTLTSLSNQISGLQSSVTSLDEKLQALEERVAALESKSSNGG